MPDRRSRVRTPVRPNVEKAVGYSAYASYRMDNQNCSSGLKHLQRKAVENRRNGVGLLYLPHVIAVCGRNQLTPLNRNKDGGPHQLRLPNQRARFQIPVGEIININIWVYILISVEDINMAFMLAQRIVTFPPPFARLTE